ncbi:LemA protein [Desulfitobacterium sp. LBE]|nr:MULTISPECIES: LemA family protein [Desulfitobacterium]TWH58212.1 LemA protein [Desulfitobacterium sp. LBE]CDX04709.1 LemA protein [Desulfitobacterium hafniense]SHN88376.1 LemA protein [Desulfitobacterium chlororespirans DSM 11544]
MKKWLIPVGIIIILAMILGSGYNNLVTLSETVDSSWSQVENQLQRRADLIPNLVNTVKGYAEHESEVFTDVADARSRLIGAGSVGEAAEADAALSSALSRLLAISESYPQLKADANFRALQDELAGTENRIATARMDYNNEVQSYNTKIKRFPATLYAGILGFDEREYFKADAGAHEAPTVDFSK